jgi:hypothetical protein
MTDFELTPWSAPAPSPDGPKPGETRAETRHRLERRRQQVMHTTYGAGPAGQTCGACDFLVRVEGNTRRYRKCERYGISSAESTDWRGHWPACGAFRPRLGQE